MLVLVGREVKRVVGEVPKGNSGKGLNWGKQTGNKLGNIMKGVKYIEYNNIPNILYYLWSLSLYTQSRSVGER